MKGRIFTISIFAFFLGVYIHSAFFPFSIPLILPIFLLVLSFLFFIPKYSWMKYLAWGMIFLSIGLIRFDLSLNKQERLRNNFIPFVQSGDDYSFIGKISERPLKEKYGREKVILQISKIYPETGNQEDAIDMGGKVISHVKTRGQELRYGQVVLLKGKLREIENFEGDNGRIFDYKHFLAKDTILYELQAKDIRVLSPGKKDVRAMLYGVKDYFLRKIFLILPKPESSLLAGLLLGEKTALPDKVEESFRRTGLMHIVVLSGYNVSIVIMAMLFLLSWLPERWKMIFAFLGIISFTILVGAGPTVVRAALMASLLLLSRILGKVAIAERILLLVAFLMVFYNPWILQYDISFQLSFLATYGLMEWMPFFEKRLSWIPNIFEFKESLSATLSAQLMVFPLILFFMGTLSLVSPIVNMLVLFIVPIAMLLGFLLVISSTLLPFFTPILKTLSYLSLHYIIFVTDIFSQFRLSEIQFPPFSGYLLFLLYLAVAFLIYLKRKKAKLMED